MDDGLAIDGTVGRLRGSEHLVQFYEDDARLAETVADYVGAGIEAGGSGVVVAGPAHRDLFARRLRRRGLDLEALAREGRYRALDTAQLLSRFVVDGWPDARLFEETCGPIVARTASGAGAAPVRVFGDMVSSLWEQGKHEAAIHVERLWNDLGRRLSFSLLCAYPVSAFDGEADGRSILQIWTEHGQVCSPAE